MKLLNGCQAKPGRQAPAVKRFLHPLVFQAVTYARPLRSHPKEGKKYETFKGRAYVWRVLERSSLTTRPQERASNRLQAITLLEALSHGLSIHLVYRSFQRKHQRWDVRPIDGWSVHEAFSFLRFMS